MGALFFGSMSFVIFHVLCYPELRRNLMYLPAMCQPYNDGVIYPEVKPYRHCYQACNGCMESWAPVPCSVKSGMHLSINEYDLTAMRYIAGSCGGSSCCAQEVCQTCTKCARVAVSRLPSCACAHACVLTRDLPCMPTHVC